MWGRRASPFLRWYLDLEYDDVPIDIYRIFKEEMEKELVNNPEGVTLPLNLGWLKIIGFKIPAKTYIRKDGKVHTVMYPSDQTDGLVFKARWYSLPVGVKEDTIKTQFENSSIYSFKPSRALRKVLYAAIKAGKWRDYHTQSFFLAPRISKQFGLRKTNDRLRRRAFKLERRRIWRENNPNHKFSDDRKNYNIENPGGPEGTL